ncbi:TPA: hypothetical protein HO125_004290 [Escherichia coli]|nr:hypothetical protein [Escherichia coli]
MADILREITAWTLILTGLATCLSAGAALAALLMHITTPGQRFDASRHETASFFSDKKRNHS